MPPPAWIRERSGGEAARASPASGTPRGRPQPPRQLVMGSTPLPRPSPHTPGAASRPASTPAAKRLVQTSISAHLLRKAPLSSKTSSEPRPSTSASLTARRTASSTPLAARDSNVDRPRKRVKGNGKQRQSEDDDGTDDNENASPSTRWNGSLTGGVTSRPAPRLASPAFDPLAVFGPAPPATMSSQRDGRDRRGLSRTPAPASPLKRVVKQASRSPSAPPDPESPPSSTPFMHESLSNFSGLDWERAKEERMSRYRRLAGLSPKEKQQDEARRQARIKKAERELQAAVQRSMGDRVRSWATRRDDDERPSTDGEATDLQRLRARHLDQRGPRPLTPLAHPSRNADRHATPPLPRGRQEKHADAMLERISSLSPEQRHRILGRTLAQQQGGGSASGSSSTQRVPLAVRFQQGSTPAGRASFRAPVPSTFAEPYSIVHVLGDLDAASSEAEEEGDGVGSNDVGDTGSDDESHGIGLQPLPHVRSPRTRRRVYALETQHSALALATSLGGPMSDPLPESPSRELALPLSPASPSKTPSQARYDAAPSSSQTLPGGTLSPPRFASQTRRSTARALLDSGAGEEAGLSDDDATQPLDSDDIERYGPIESLPTQELFAETYMSDSDGDSAGGGDYFDGRYDETYREPSRGPTVEGAERSLPERSARPIASLKDRTWVQPAVEWGTPRPTAKSKAGTSSTPSRKPTVDVADDDVTQPLPFQDETQPLPFASQSEAGDDGDAGAAASSSQTQPLTWATDEEASASHDSTPRPPRHADEAPAVGPAPRHPAPRTLPRWQALQDVWEGVDLSEPSQPAGASNATPTPSHLQSSLDRFGFSRTAAKRKREEREAKWLGPDDASRRLDLSDDEGFEDEEGAAPPRAAQESSMPPPPPHVLVEETQALPWGESPQPPRASRTLEESELSARTDVLSEMSSQGLALLPSPSDMDTQARRFLEG